MDRRERAGDASTAMLAAFDGLKASVWTAMPGFIESYDPAKKTCNVKPALMCQQQQEDGSWIWVNMPLLLDCPVFFPGGGGCTLTFPLAPGDECLVIFADRCIDAWWDSGQVSLQAELRLHDLSDGFCFVGVSSKPNVPASANTAAVELRSNDGGAKITLNPSTHDVTVAATTINLNGTLNINGQAYAAHRHSGVQPGAGNTGGIV